MSTKSLGTLGFLTVVGLAVPALGDKPAAVDKEAKADDATRTPGADKAASPVNTRGAARAAEDPGDEGLRKLLEVAGTTAALENAKAQEAALRAKAAEEEKARAAQEKQARADLEQKAREAARRAVPKRDMAPTAAAPSTGMDDNNSMPLADGPTGLPAVDNGNGPKHRGAYELGPLDCRVLDGDGRERLLPPLLTAGEEPDLLCRIIVTQPAKVASEEHTITLRMKVGSKETFKFSRKVRMSSKGRRALVFQIAADYLGNGDPATSEGIPIRVSAILSEPVTPAEARVTQVLYQSLD